MPNLVAERRAFPRYPLILAAEVVESATGVRLKSRTSDVSRSGCYVDTLNPMPAGTLVRVILTHNGESIEMPARIVYASPGLGMGVCFENPIPPGHVAILGGWLAAIARSTR